MKGVIFVFRWEQNLCETSICGLLTQRPPIVLNAHIMNPGPCYLMGALWVNHLRASVDASNILNW